MAVWIRSKKYKYVMKYTTVNGVEGFDGVTKKAEKAVVKKIV